jgi:hypothetical protein
VSIRISGLLIAVIIVLCYTSAFSVDYWGAPPDNTWTRGDAGTAFSHHTFYNSNPVMEPEFVDNPFGTVVHSVDGGYWSDTWECPTEMEPGGTVDGFHFDGPCGGSITIEFTNSELDDGAKYIYIQLTSSRPPTSVEVSAEGGSPTGYTYEIWQTGRPHIHWPGSAPFDGNWCTYSFGFLVQPNPQKELITLHFHHCTVVDQIVIDTFCTTAIATEPSTWGSIRRLFRPVGY